MSLSADDWYKQFGPVIEEPDDDEKAVDQIQNQLVPAEPVAAQPNVTIQQKGDPAEGLALILQQHWTPEQARHVSALLLENMRVAGVNQYNRGSAPIYQTTAAAKAIEAVKEVLLYILRSVPNAVWVGVITYLITFFPGFLRAVNAWYYGEARLLEAIADAHDSSVKKAVVGGGGTAVVQSQWFQQVGIGLFASAATALGGYAIRAVTGM